MTVAAATPARDQVTSGLAVVTGAFSYSGAAIASALQRNGREVRTLTGHPERAGVNCNIDARPLAFDDPPGLVASLRGATTLYNTYWVRFARGRVDHMRAVENSRVLFHVARRAGIERIVHVSITNPAIDSPYPYFRGKALVERALAESGVPYTILRPAILFGADGVLINNIAWLLRRLPVFAIGGDGRYRIRPIHIDDLAELCVAAAAAPADDDQIIDAVGAERPTFAEMVETIRRAVGSRARVVHVPGALIPVLSAGLNALLHDVLLTRDEYRAMAGNLADTTGAATGRISFAQWVVDNGATLGVTYANEIDRHFR
jgi:uncharacterized protein YbjT (DUF2867 family)